MNNKVSKHLRKMAEEMTSGKPMTEYNIAQVQKQTMMNGKIRFSPAQVVVMSKQCTRSVYKQLKKQYEDGKAGKITEV